jgi:hypothetical protein
VKAVLETLSLTERLALAQKAFLDYRSACFWSLAPDFKVSAETLPIIINGLRNYGDRRAFELAAHLCR